MVTLDPAAFQWLGYGYGKPGAGIIADPAGSGIIVAFSPAPAEHPEAAQLAGFPYAGWIDGHRYKLTAVIVNLAGGRPVRLAHAFTESSEWSKTIGVEETLSFEIEWSAGESAFIGIESSPAPPASSVRLVSLDVEDLSAPPAKPKLDERVPVVYAPGIAFLDPFRVELPMTIKQGRSSITEQPDAASLSFSWLGDLSLSWGGTETKIEAGLPIVVAFDPSAELTAWDDVWHDEWSDGTAPPWTGGKRFTGVVTDVKPDRSAGFVRSGITAIGRMVELAELYVGDTPWPAQTEDERVKAIAALLPVGALTSRGSSFRILPRDVDRKKPLDVLRELAGSTGALVYELTDGTVRYDGPELRSTASAGVPVELPETVIVDAVGWSQSIDTISNVVSIEYGVAPKLPDGSEGDRPIYTLKSDESIARYRRTREKALTTELAELDDVKLLAATFLRRWAFVSWEAPQVIVRADLASDFIFDELMKLGVSDLVSTRGITEEPSADGGVGEWFVEGWQETFNRESRGAKLSHEIQLAVSASDRWLLAQKAPATVVATPSSSSFNFGTPLVVTVQLTTAGDPAGKEVQLLEGSRILARTTLNAAGAATLPAVTLGAGRHELVVKTDGSRLLMPASTSFVVDVKPVAGVKATLTISPSPVNAGSNATLTATLVPATATGSVRFEWSTDGTVWHPWQSAALHAGKAALAWGANNPAAAWRWRAVYAGDANHGAATSPAVALDVRQASSAVVTLDATWTATYQQDGDKRAGISELYQGRFSSTNGNQRSLAGFAIALPAGAVVTKVELFLDATVNQATTAIIGHHNRSSEPASWPSGVSSDEKRVDFGKGTAKWIDVSSIFKGPLNAGAFKGIALGPAPNDSLAYYGSFDRARLRITYTRFS